MKYFNLLFCAMVTFSPITCSEKPFFYSIDEIAMHGSSVYMFGKYPFTGFANFFLLGRYNNKQSAQRYYEWLKKVPLITEVTKPMQRDTRLTRPMQEVKDIHLAIKAEIEDATRFAEPIEGLMNADIRAKIQDAWAKYFDSYFLDFEEFRKYEALSYGKPLG